MFPKQSTTNTSKQLHQSLSLDVGNEDIKSLSPIITEVTTPTSSSPHLTSTSTTAMVTTPTTTTTTFESFDSIWPLILTDETTPDTNNTTDITPHTHKTSKVRDLYILNGCTMKDKKGGTVVIRFETPNSCKEIYEQVGRFCRYDSHVHEELEFMIRDAFIDRLYDDDDDDDDSNSRSAMLLSEEDRYNINKHPMFCLTLRKDTYDGIPTGIIFWREIDDKYMHGWIKTPTIDDSELVQSDSSHTSSLSSPVATISLNSNVLTPTSTNTPTTILTPTVLTPSHPLFKRWMKIELVATNPDFLGLGIGKRLMTAAFLASAARTKDKCVLHIAGGSKNVVATSLYSQFGFQHVPKTFFNLPNNDLYILTDIVDALKNVVPWHEFDFRAPTQTTAIQNASDDLDHDHDHVQDQDQEQKSDIIHLHLKTSGNNGNNGNSGNNATEFIDHVKSPQIQWENK